MMDAILRPFQHFNSISVLSGHWADDNERLCAMEPLLRLARFPTPAVLEPETARQ